MNMTEINLPISKVQIHSESLYPYLQTEGLSESLPFTELVTVLHSIHRHGLNWTFDPVSGPGVNPGAKAPTQFWTFRPFLNELKVVGRSGPVTHI